MDLCTKKLPSKQVHSAMFLLRLALGKSIENIFDGCHHMM
jgi:hypothetical protein